jgi:hypothetical protein
MQNFWIGIKLKPQTETLDPQLLTTIENTEKTPQTIICDQDDQEDQVLYLSKYREENISRGKLPDHPDHPDQNQHVSCHFCGTFIPTEEVMIGDLTFGNPAHKICYRYNERKQQSTSVMKQPPIVYWYEHIPPGMQCRMCEARAVEYVLTQEGHKPERLCEHCFTMRKNCFVDAQWKQKMIEHIT